MPLSAFTHYAADTAPLQVNHQGQFPAVTISFNLPPGVALGDAVTAIEAAEREIGLPPGIHGSFAGTAQAYQDSLASEPILIAAALVTVYIVLGVLYESYIHPITILSTLPSAGVGALLALMYFHTELSVIALIGIILLVGIVKKNAIMMIDFALEAERNEGKSPEEAIYQACLLRFRPITMTTMAALLGGLPLAIGFGIGSELRRPLGHRDRRRPAVQPDAHAVHDAGRLPVSRPRPSQVGARACRAFHAGGLRCIERMRTCKARRVVRATPEGFLCAQRLLTLLFLVLARLWLPRRPEKRRWTFTSSTWRVATPCSSSGLPESRC